MIRPMIRADTARRAIVFGVIVVKNVLIEVIMLVPEAKIAVEEIPNPVSTPTVAVPPGTPFTAVVKTVNDAAFVALVAAAVAALVAVAVAVAAVAVAAVVAFAAAFVAAFVAAAVAFAFAFAAAFVAAFVARLPNIYNYRLNLFLRKLGELP
jgi:hypothetical protein